MSESESSILNIPVCLEALLFVAIEPVSVSQLAAALEVSSAVVETGLKELQVSLQGRGLRLQQHAGRYQLTTAPELSGWIERFLGLEATSHLSHAALDTLAVIAYKQPVTRPQLDAVRGVNSDGVIKSLLGKGLIHEVGRGDGPGRPILYGTTSDFLRHFGMDSLNDMPPMNIVVIEKIQPDEALKN